MILESTRRRADFKGGISVRLDDGQDWYFPEPDAGMVAEWDGAGMSRQTIADFGADIDAAPRGFDSSEAMRRYADSHIGLAAVMLLTNYDLDGAELAGLFRWSPRDPADRARWARIGGIARGTITRSSDRPQGDASPRDARIGSACLAAVESVRSASTS